MVIEKLEGRKGEEQEFVEFMIAEANRSYIAQKSGQWWIVYENDTRPNGPVTMLERYPLYRRSKAIAAARAAAEAFAAQATIPAEP